MQRAIAKSKRPPAQFFAKYDASGDGMLDGSELLQMIRTDLKIPAAEVDDATVQLLVRALDDDGGGTLAIDEILDFLEHGSATFFSGGATSQKQPVGPDWMLRLALTVVTNTRHPAYDTELMALLPEAIGGNLTLQWANDLLKERVPSHIGPITWRYDDDDFPEARKDLRGGTSTKSVAVKSKKGTDRKKTILLDRSSSAQGSRAT
jgi:hypothetical protein